MDLPSLIIIGLSLSGSILALLLSFKQREMDKQQIDSDQYRARTDALLSSLGEGIVVTDTKGNVQLINKQAERLLQWNVADALGKPWYEVAPLINEHGETVAPEKRSTQIVLQTGKTRTSNLYFYLRRDGTKFAVATTAAPIIFEKKIIGSIAVFRDVTREREIDRAKSEFVSLASHQLRTPLSAIKWFSEMLLNGDAGNLSTEQKDFVNNINQSNDRMIVLVNSLLNISRIESGRIIIDPSPTDLGRLVQHVVDMLKMKLDQKKISLAISVYPDLQEINVDQKLITEVYSNLLTNAIKYTPEGGKIMVTISRKDKEIVSQVTDSGFGIPKDEQHRVFERFYRGSNIIKKETDGTGLGLYLVKAIIESSQGKIWFKSDEGKGTSFWFSLPVSGSIRQEGEVTITPST